MRHKKAMKWMAAILLLTLSLAAFIPGTGAAPPAQEPDSIVCGDSITCSTAGNAVYVKNTSTGPSIYGHNTSSGEGLKGRGNPGVYGFSYFAAGIRGKSNQGVGVKGESVDKYGVQGISTNDTGVHGSGPTGVYGESDMTTGLGVHGVTSATTGQAIGVRGETASTSGFGVFGRATADSGSTYGVYGRSDSTAGRGVVGWADADNGDTYGLFGRSSSTDGVGAYGWASAGTGATNGVRGESDSIEGRGVVGRATAGIGTTYGVFGRSDSISGRGVYGFAATGVGVNYGVYGRTASVVGYGVYSEGAFAATGAKSAIVSTEDYGWRHLYSMESPDVLFEDVGTAQLVNGQAVVVIEPIFAGTVNLEEPYQVFLTPVCEEPVLLFVSAQGSSSFTVQGVTLSGEPAACSFHYRIIAKRLGYEDIRLAPAADPDVVRGRE